MIPTKISVVEIVHFNSCLLHFFSLTRELQVFLCLMGLQFQVFELHLLEEFLVAGLCCVSVHYTTGMPAIPTFFWPFRSHRVHCTEIGNGIARDVPVDGRPRHTGRFLLSSLYTGIAYVHLNDIVYKGSLQYWIEKQDIKHPPSWILF